MRGASRALVSVVVLVGCVAASADGLDVKVGLGGVHRTGAWTPIVATLPERDVWQTKALAFAAII